MPLHFIIIGRGVLDDHTYAGEEYADFNAGEEYARSNIPCMISDGDACAVAMATLAPRLSFRVYACLLGSGRRP